MLFSLCLSWFRASLRGFLGVHPLLGSAISGSRGISREDSQGEVKKNRCVQSKYLFPFFISCSRIRHFIYVDGYIYITSRSKIGYLGLCSLWPGWTASCSWTWDQWSNGVADLEPQVCRNGVCMSSKRQIVYRIQYSFSHSFDPAKVNTLKGARLIIWGRTNR